LIAWKQEDRYGRHTDLAFGNPDFVQLAEAFGWNGFRCDNSADLRDTLETSFEAEGPSLVVIPIDYSENQKLTEHLRTVSLPI
jgi:acetolactate synthase-1/2/3 large subunit